MIQLVQPFKNECILLTHWKAKHPYSIYIMKIRLKRGYTIYIKYYRVFLQKRLHRVFMLKADDGLTYLQKFWNSKRTDKIESTKRLINFFIEEYKQRIILYKLLNKSLKILGLNYHIYHYFETIKNNQSKKTLKTLGGEFSYIPKFFSDNLPNQYFFNLINLNIVIIYFFIIFSFFI